MVCIRMGLTRVIEILDKHIGERTTKKRGYIN